MSIRPALPPDLDALVQLAEKLELAYADMRSDRWWVAEEGGRIVGIAGLKIHADSEELVSLGVAPAYRSRGLGSKLVAALLAGRRGEIHLATIIPEYFQRLGFAPTIRIPASLRHRDPAWCAGCPREKCVIMMRPAR